MSSHTDLTQDLEERARLLDDWVAVRQQIAALEAKAAGLLWERILIHDADLVGNSYHRDAIARSMISEYAAAGHLSKGSIEYAFADARALTDTFPAIREAFAGGAITARHVREIIRAAAPVCEAVRNRVADADIIALYETAVLVVAEADTPARTRAHARQVAAALAGETVVERTRRAHDARGVTVRSLDDGLAELTVVLPEEIAVAIMDRLTQMARHVTTARGDRDPVLDSDVLDDGPDPIYPGDLPPDCDVSAFTIFGDTDTFTTDPLIDPDSDASSPDIEHLPGDTRTLDQIRADLITDLLLAADPTAVHGNGLDNIQARIQVTIAATTLAGADSHPAELDGHGSLDPEIARILAGNATGWARLFLDPSGMVVETDNYTPTAAMKRYLRARDQHCRFPGCHMPVHRCDVDHNHDHAKGGPTHLDNLSHFCRGHHALKHPDVHNRHRWSAQGHPDGTITWHSPLGRTYPDPAPRRVMFV